MIYGNVELTDGTRANCFYDYHPVTIGQEFIVGNGNGGPAYITKRVVRLLDAKPQSFEHCLTGERVPMPIYAYDAEVSA